jgi:hypothetical protein
VAGIIRQAVVRRIESIGLVCFASLLAFPTIFSTLAPYDDEGYCMSTLRTYLEGSRLYGETHTQYGPAYYQCVAPIHDWLLPLTQFFVRLKTIVVWVAAVVLTYGIALRFGTPRIPSVLLAAVMAVHLDKLALEPGHPQEVVLLGFLFAMFVAINPKTGWSTWSALGLIAAVVGLTKLNCGLVLAVPLMASTLANIGPRALPAASVLAALPGAMVAWMARSDPLTSLWACVVALSSAIFVWKNGYDSRESNRWSFVQVVVAAAIGCFAMLSVTLAEGTSLRELFHGLVGQHADFAGDFFKPLLWTIGTSAAWIVSILLVVFRREHADRHIHALALGLVVLLLLASSSTTSLVHGLIPRGAGMFLLWFVPFGIHLINPKCFGSTMPSRFVVLLAICSPLIAFPVSGTQIEIGTVPGLILLGSWIGKSQLFEVRVGSSYHRVAIAGVAALSFVTLFANWSRYIGNEPLRLPGSQAMRLPSEVVREQQAIVKAIEATGSDKLIFEGHNNNRFYFWTKSRPLTFATPTFWPRFLDERERREFREQLLVPGRYCVVRVPNYEAFYDDRTIEIQGALRHTWQPVSQIDDWHVGVVEIE